jgi:hypothetical protein
MQWGEVRKCNIFAKTRVSSNILSKHYNYLQKHATSVRVQLLLTSFTEAAGSPPLTILKGGMRRMLIRLADTSWGPQFLVPTISIKHYSGRVLLRETLDDEMLRKELDAMRVSGQPFAYSNGWYIRKKGTQTWIKVGESTAREHDFGIRLDTTELENGAYQVLGFMSAKVKTDDMKEIIVSRQNIADFEIRN